MSEIDDFISVSGKEKDEKIKNKKPIEDKHSHTHTYARTKCSELTIRIFARLKMHLVDKSSLL